MAVSTRPSRRFLTESFAAGAVCELSRSRHMGNRGISFFGPAELSNSDGEKLGEYVVNDQWPTTVNPEGIAKVLADNTQSVRRPCGDSGLSQSGGGASSQSTAKRSSDNRRPWRRRGIRGESMASRGLNKRP